MEPCLCSPICLHSGDRHSITFYLFFIHLCLLLKEQKDWRHSCTPSCVSPVTLALDAGKEKVCLVTGRDNPLPIYFRINFGVLCLLKQKLSITIVWCPRDSRYSR